MENMENVVMNGDVMTDGAVDAVESGLGGKVGKGLLILGVGAGIAMLMRKGVEKIKNTIEAKKAKKADVVVEEYDEVACEEE